jgi:hypothetical protein
MIEFKGKQYPTRTVEMKDIFTGKPYTALVGGDSLSDVLDWDGEDQEFASKFYHWVEDPELKLTDKELYGLFIESEAFFINTLALTGESNE